ncbi:leucyl aminopeptidase family protein [Flavobacterium sp. CYK-55]|uniref:leucyl aminopeptidase family protein n=1 Tax=Flavobacterium sp. CYK-55 TaxID=2835529 RepID=UPI001BD08A46|nr:leucyl aminopeptidase family protein [Flavobacterium sp. CYK-55]MBS7786881.1 leucyl aminopeptidase family protein [Flavobacterium sp. CYK-55]
MKTIEIKNLEAFSGLVLIPVFETNPQNVVPIEFHGVSIPSKVFYGKKDTHYLVEKYDCLHLFIGLGKKIDYQSLKTIFRRIAANEKERFGKNVALYIPEIFTLQQVEAVISGLSLGAYHLGHFKEKQVHPLLEKEFSLSILSKNDHTETITRAVKIGRAQKEVMQLVDLPSNVVTPSYLSQWAQDMGAAHGFSTRVLDAAACKIEGLDAFLSVGKGSAKEPQFIMMDYQPTGDKLRHIGLVGKGITFDTGGLNIKTAGMVHMKSDMAGAAAVLGAMVLIADLKLPVRVTAIVPCCENAVDKDAFYPSDVINSYQGATIEVIDTDAEGRLILADGLSYLIKNFKPEIVVDLATLTGSCVATFGYECAGLFTNNPELQQKLQYSGDAIGERMWPLPLWDAYASELDSDIADVKNYHGKPYAGAITAAKFLEYFTDKHTAWAHLDIAGVAFIDDEFAKSKHASAYGTYLLTHFIENL